MPQRIVTRVLHGLAARFGSVDEGKPSLIDWQTPVTPVIDVSRAASAHSPNFADGWVDLTFLCVGNPTAVADVEHDVDIAASLLGFGGAGGGSVNVQGDQAVWVTNCTVLGRAVPATAGRIALYRHLSPASTVLEDVQLLGQWIQSATLAVTPFNVATPTGAPYSPGPINSLNSGISLAPLPWRFGQGEGLRIVSQDLDSGLGEEVSVNLRVWTSPDGTPPPR